MKLQELFDNPYKVVWDWSDDRDITAKFKTAQGNEIEVIFAKALLDQDLWDISFQIEFKDESGRWRRTFDISNTGDAPRIFATVLAVMSDFVERSTPDYIYFSSATSEPSRVKLYNAMVRRAASSSGKFKVVNDLSEVPEEIANYVSNMDQKGFEGWLMQTSALTEAPDRASVATLNPIGDSVKTGKPVIYIDMDGVLCDLFNRAAELNSVDHYHQMTKAQWESFLQDSDAYELFTGLPMFTTANALLEMVKGMFGGYRILSSPLSFDKAGSIAGKREWLQKHITVPADGWIFDHEKFKYAVQSDGTPNILIDDWSKNIVPWNERGGIGIKYQADENSLAELKQMLLAAKRDYQ